MIQNYPVPQILPPWSKMVAHKSRWSLRPLGSTRAERKLKIEEHIAEGQISFGE
jgi:hypothetical protein